MNVDFEWLPQVFLRAPLYSFTDYHRDNLSTVLKTTLFRNALYLASPVFYRIIAQKNFEFERLTPKEINGLMKYYNRMCFRPTPFGAFASFSIVSWSSDRQVVLPSTDMAVLHLLPSREMVVRLLTALPPEPGEERLVLNPTAYRSGDTVRFIKSVLQPSGKLNYFLTAIAGEALNLSLFELMSSTSHNTNELVAFIRNETQCAWQEARDYLDFLILEQLLYGVRNGDIFEPSPKVGRWFRPAGQDNGSASIGNSWPKADSRTVFSLGDLATTADAWFKALPGGLELPDKGIFYGALERPSPQGGLPVTDQAELWDALMVLGRLVPQGRDSALQKFKQSFKERFDQQKVPLLKALDPDSGISYVEVNDTALAESWIRDISFSRPKQSGESLDWTDAHRLFLKKWVGDANRSPDAPIILSEEDLADLAAFPPETMLPPSMAILYSRSAGRVVLDMIGGATGTALIGRFSVFSPEAERLAREVAALESFANSEVIFADIAQLSDHHIDNINRRKPVYDYHIPVNTYTDLPGDQAIALRDLVLSVQGDELILESITQGKRIIPRLATAYNFALNYLGIFRFLCELQYQGVQGNFTLDLERMFPGLEIYPRVECRGVILCPAKWHFREEHILGLTASPWSLGRLHLFRQQYHVPATVTMGNGDQQLTFNLSDDGEAMFFLSSIRGLRRMVLKEYLLPDRTVTIQKKPYSGQFIAFLAKKAVTYTGLPMVLPAEGQVDRHFVIGSNWVYLKVYSTPAAANALLTGILQPVLTQFKAHIRCWFFVRYADPSPHLRIRFSISEPEIGNLLIAFKDSMSNTAHEELIRDYRTDAYQRELERYSPELIGDIETHFHLGSAFLLHWLREAESAENLTETPVLALYMTFQLAECFWNNGALLEGFLEGRAGAMRREYANEKQVKREFDGKYREISSELNRALLGASPIRPWSNELEASMGQLLQQTAAIAEKAAVLNMTKRMQLIGDLLHMQLNRLFSSAPRQQEALVFHCLHKFAVSRRVMRTKG